MKKNQFFVNENAPNTKALTSYIVDFFEMIIDKQQTSWKTNGS